MPGYGHGGNQRQVSPAPTALGNRRRRDFHIPTAPMMKPDGKVEIQKQDSHFPTASIVYLKAQRKESPAAGRSAPASRLILQ